MLTVGNTSGEPVTAFWAVAASRVCLGNAWSPPSTVVLVLLSLIKVSPFFSPLCPAITPRWEEMREMFGVSRKTKAGGREGPAETKF